MEAELALSAAELTRLQRCINNLVSVLAPPAIWSGGDPAQILRTLLDVLLSMLGLSFVYVCVRSPDGAAPLERIRVAHPLQLPHRADEVGRMLRQRLGENPETWTAHARVSMGDRDFSLAPLRLGPQADIGVLVAASAQADFPGQSEKLLLSIAAHQAAIGLQGARLLSEQRRVASELDQRVAQRTAELAAANDELKRSAAFLAEGQRLSLTGSFSWRVPLDRITWSDQLYRIFGFELGTPVTLERIASRVHPDDLPMLFDMVAHARGDGSDFEYGHRLLMPDGSVKHLHLVAHGTRDHEGQLEYIGAVQDVTERRLSEEVLSGLRSELAHMTRVMSLGTLTASIAHEVNQPLSGIITNASTCLRMLAAEPPNVEGARETVRRTIRDGHRASEVIKRLRALFGKQVAVTESMDLNEATREVLALSVSDLQRSRVALRVELAEELPPVKGDRVQLQQVILNLLRNAVNAMSDIEDRPRQLLIRTGLCEGGQVRLTVQDTGVGLAAPHLDRLFDPFYTTRTDGMGIGLSVSRSIIESHQGRLWATANEGPGATFSFTIPCARPASITHNAPG